jgi:hypothetical protein
VAITHKAVSVEFLSSFRSDSNGAVTVVKVYRNPTGHLDYRWLGTVPMQSVVVNCLLLWLAPGCELFRPLLSDWLFRPRRWLVGCPAW